MKKYVNGYDNPRIEVIQNNIKTTYDFSFKIQALKESYEAIGDIVKLIDGRKKQYIDHYDYTWTLDYSQYIEAEDMLKFAAIEKAARSGAEIWLTPHKDLYYRKFKVLVSLNAKEIDIWYTHNGKDDTPNKSFIIEFVNADRITEVQTQDADYLPIITAESCFEN